ncbi:flavin reductase family protein [Streptomyces sp. NPDC015345]|uniref:flavin reductase family protein n=1 Tax=Streptomyces sp. NPDC015345 TaxID=3364953 RepID=UPI0036FBBC35
MAEPTLVPGSPPLALLDDASPAVTADGYRAAVSRLPTGVTVITASGPEGPVGCTANAVMSLSLEPPSLLVSLGGRSATLERIRAAGSFAVNVLTWSDRALTRKFATGTAAERFAGVGWDLMHQVPVLSRSAAAMVCEVHELVPLFDHTLVVGTVTWAQAGEADPAVYYGNELRALRPVDLASGSEKRT